MQPPNFPQRLKAFLGRHFDNIGLAGGLLVLVFITFVCWQIDPQGGSLPPGTLQLLALPPFILFLILHAAIWTYKNLQRPGFKYLKAETNDLFTEALPDWSKLPGHQYDLGHRQTRNAIIYYTLRFLIPCVRTILSWLPLFYFVHLLHQLVLLSLTLVPH